MEPFHTYYQSPLGIIRVSGTDEFISEMSFIDNIQQPPPVPQLHQTMPSLLKEAIRQLDEYFQGQRRTFDFSLQQQGTEFQQKVWHELGSIGFGKTISYLDLAKRLGDPKVIRASAAANGKNNIAIVVPCHRVIGSKSDLVGYAGGLWRKKWLLEHENKVANGVLTLF